MDEDREKTYDPSTVEIDRGRQQGLGMGERDLKGQRDPGGVSPAASDEENEATEDGEAGDKGAGI